MIAQPANSKDDQGARERRGPRLRWIGWLAAVVVFAACWLWASRRHTRVAEPPTINLESCTPSVAVTISRARDDVLRTPRSADPWGRLGMLLVAHQFELEAMTCFAEAARLDPAEFRWPYLHGVSLLVTDREAALAQFRRAVELRGEVGVARSRLGEVLLDVGRYDEAEEHLRAAHRLEPDGVRPLVDLARLAYLRDQPEVAIRWAEQAVRLAPDERAPHELLAMTYHRQGHRDLADRELRIVESLPVRPLMWNDPVAVEVVKLRRDAAWSLEQAESLIAQGQMIQAIRVLEDALRRDSQNPRVPCALARALIQVGQIGAAEDLLDHALRLHPQTAEVQFQRGVVYFFQKQHEDAAASFQRAVQLKPDYVLAHYNLGHTLERLGDEAAALAAFGEVIHYRPAHALAHKHLGRILLDQGQVSGALEHLRIAVRLDPQDEEAQRFFQQAAAAAGGKLAAPASE